MTMPGEAVPVNTTEPNGDGREMAEALPRRGSLRDVAVLFLKLGFTAFGGPAAHIAMMRDEVVRRRQWVTDQHFLDLLGASNLIPGPSSTEMAIYLGFDQAGLPGLILAGVLFILPAMLIVLALAWAYARYGATPQANWLLYGIKPVIIAIILQALWGLARTAMKSALLLAAGTAVLILYLLGGNVLALLFGAGFAIMLLDNARRLRSGAAMVLVLPGLGRSLLLGAVPAAAFSLATLFLNFLLIGATLYGSGYVLLAYLRHDFVQSLGWLTDRQLLDAIAVGQFTPGPVFTTATFIGYILGGVPGALLATLGIFLPSFVFVALVYPLVGRLRRSPWTSAWLDGVNAAALGLMAAVTWQLGQAAIVDWLTAGLAFIALVILLRWRPNSAWVVLAGAATGLGYHLLTR